MYLEGKSGLNLHRMKDLLSSSHIPVNSQPIEQPEQTVEHKITYNWKDKVISNC